jgi:hypothetical protein
VALLAASQASASMDKVLARVSVSGVLSDDGRRRAVAAGA